VATSYFWWLFSSRQKYHIIFAGPPMAAKHKVMFSGFFFSLAGKKPMPPKIDSGYFRQPM
jgi:hypothetical protein